MRIAVARTGGHRRRPTQAGRAGAIGMRRRRLAKSSNMAHARPIRRMGRTRRGTSIAVIGAIRPPTAIDRCPAIPLGVGAERGKMMAGTGRANATSGSRVFDKMTVRFMRVSFVAAIVSFAVLNGAMMLPSRADSAKESTSTSVRAFFPARPSRAKLHTISGVLSDFGIGNGLGSLELRKGNSVTVIYTGAKLRLDGRLVACDHPPKKGERKSMFCTSWPSNVVVGSTLVSATYWMQTRPDLHTQVKVTDELHTVKGAI